MIRSDAVVQQSADERRRRAGPQPPLVTYALFAYNQEASVEAAVRSALAQTWSNLEIILSDDCSTDNTFSIMKRVHDTYHGTHTIILNRNRRNLGVTQHVNALMRLARGGLVIAAAGDDLSDPTRTAKLVGEWERTGFAAGTFHSGYHTMDLRGHVTRTSTSPSIIHPQVEDLIFNNVVTGATEAWSREIFEFFGPLNESLHIEDINIAMRGALLGGVHYIPEPLVTWQTGGMSNIKSMSIGESRRRNTMWYTMCMTQTILDADTALRKKVISNDRFNAIITRACDRLMFETLLRNRSTSRLLQDCLLDWLRSCRRTVAAIYKSTLLSIGSRR